MTRLLILMLFLTTMAGVSSGASATRAAAQESYPLKPTCPDSLQASIDVAAPGSVLAVRTDCIYRESLDVNKPLVLDGQGGAEIRGSDIWSTWIPANGLWVSANTVPVFESEGICDEESDGRCLWREQVFRDGVPLRQIPNGTVPGPGEFSLNVGRQVVVAEDPSNAIMEVSTRQLWLRIHADDITIQGFRMRHAATQAQNGAIRIDHVSNWTVQDNVLSDAHAANVYYRFAPNGHLLNNELFNGGQLGFGGRGDNVLIQSNSVHHNNTEAFSNYWEAGGAKVVESSGVVVDGNFFFENDGPGFWCDIDCVDATISNNNVNHNVRVGIFFEISDGAEIFGNTVWENIESHDERGWGGIFVSSSRNANVYDNVVAWNGDGITVISQCRSFLDDGETCDLEHPWNNVYGNQIHNNVIIMGHHEEDTDALALGWLRDIEVANGEPYAFMFSPDANNQGYENAYWITTADDSGDIGFAWDDEEYLDLDEFNATPGEENGVYLNDDERDEVLEQAGVPLEPEIDAHATPQ